MDGENQGENPYYKIIPLADGHQVPGFPAVVPGGWTHSGRGWSLCVVQLRLAEGGSDSLALRLEVLTVGSGLVDVATFEKGLILESKICNKSISYTRKCLK